MKKVMIAMMCGIMFGCAPYLALGERYKDISGFSADCSEVGGEVKVIGPGDSGKEIWACSIKDEMVLLFVKEAR